METITPAVPVAPAAGSATVQIIAVVILVIIGIVLFVIFIVVLVNVPPPQITPFADKSRIRIKALTNNLYLKPVPCSGITGCDGSAFLPCNNGETENLVAAIGLADEPLVQWVLCQFSGLTSPTNTGDAAYMIYSESSQGTQIMRFVNGVLTTTLVNQACIASRTDAFICPGDGRHFSFILNEKAIGGSGNTTSGSYQMTLACNIASPLVCFGVGTLNPPSPGCPPLVFQSGLNLFNCSSLDNPRCTLNSLFEIDVLGQESSF